MTLDELRPFGADVDEGITRCLNNEDFYLQMVESIKDEEAFDSLEHAVAARDLDAAFDIAFVDEDGLVYTANEGIVDEIDQYSRKRNGLDAHLPHTRERNQQSHRVGNRWDRHP
ncbi:MAG: hypothetical protein Q4A07_02885 [Coriobacteriales bacterium]|nr:hypothetical protein [Coriobacteriales bacterium]